MVPIARTMRFTVPDVMKIRIRDGQKSEDSRYAAAKRGDSVMQRAYREMLSTHMIAVMLTISACIVGVFVVVGPMGSHDALTLPQRLVFGSVYAAAGWPISYSMNVIALYFLRSRKPREIVAALTLLALFEAFPCSAIAYSMETLAHPSYAAAIGFLRLYTLVATTATACNLLFLYLVYQRVKHRTACAVVITGYGDDVLDTDEHNHGRPRGEFSAVPEPSTAGADATVGECVQGDRGSLTRREPTGKAVQPHAKIPDLLPTNLGTDLVYLKSEDHYIDVHTSVGSTLIKMRFSDAVAELDDRGIQVHRSYWVATRHIQRLVRNGRRTLIHLTGGHRVPVSVSHLPAVRATVTR